ncbi:hypothetical protein ABS735_23645 [Streptomyces sp. MMCC 100]|uniref:hypothetical protein n=1 Tax=Streptomyces sp. MMCC 100 TaxID=3163555 RepID=UPI003599003F
MTSDLAFRPLTGPEEIQLFNALPGPYNDRLAEDLRNGHCGADWMWLAPRDGRPVARVGRWSRSGSRPDVVSGSARTPNLLAEGTRLLTAQGAERVTADTDLGNRPMARAFERAGYDDFAGRIDMRWD